MMILKIGAALVFAAFAWTGDEIEGGSVAQVPGLTVSSGTPGGWTMPPALETSTGTTPSPEPTEEP